MAFNELSEVNYCLRCGGQLAQAERYGRLRPVCQVCGWIYFADPKVAVAALIEQDGKVLLVRRAMNPHRGLWTLPAGFVDADENPVQALERECMEEMGLRIRVTGLVDVLSGQEHPRGANIVVVYRAEIQGGDMHPADDVDAVAFFALNDLPELAFATTRKILGT